MQEGWFYIKDTEHFLQNIQNMEKIPQDSILVTADVVGLYPRIPNNAGLSTLKDALHCRQNKKIPTDMLVKVAGATFGAKFAPMSQKQITFLVLSKATLSRKIMNLIVTVSV